MTLLGVKGVYGSTNKPPINTITIWADPITQIHILKISWYWAYVRPQDRERDNGKAQRSIKLKKKEKKLEQAENL